MARNPGMVPFDEAIAWATAQKVVLPAVYYSVLQGLARSAAFTVAGLTNLAQLQLVLGSMQQALAEGTPFEQWRKQVESGEIGLDLPRHRLENIFRTNMQSWYARGRCEQQKRVADAFPYLLYDAVNDSRTRPAHAAMDGFVAKRDDPIWSTWRPPCGYQCRCRTIALTEEQAARYIAIDQEAMKDRDRLDARSRAVAEGPDAGWEYDLCADPNAGTERAKEGDGLDGMDRGYWADPKFPRSADAAQSRADVADFADDSLPSDTKHHEFHAVPLGSPEEVDRAMASGLDDAGLYPDNEGMGDHVLVRLPLGAPRKLGAIRRLFGLAGGPAKRADRIEPGDIIRAVRTVELEAGPVTETELARIALESDGPEDYPAGMPERYRHWFR